MLFYAPTVIVFLSSSTAVFVVVLLFIGRNKPDLIVYLVVYAFGSFNNEFRRPAGFGFLLLYAPAITVFLSSYMAVVVAEILFFWWKQA